MDEGHLQHAGEIGRCLLEAGENPPAFLEPADEPLNDVAAAIRLLVKFHRTCVAILVGLGGDYGRNVEVQQGFVDPVRAIRFVARQGVRPRHRPSLAIGHFAIGASEHRQHRSRFVFLSRRKMEVQRMAEAIAQQMDFGGEAAAATA